MKKLSNTEAELKKSVAYKETCIGLDLAGVPQKKDLCLSWIFGNTYDRVL